MKYMVVGKEVLLQESDRAPIIVKGDDLANVGHFLYLGSVVAADEMIDMDMERKFSHESTAPAIHRCQSSYNDD